MFAYCSREVGQLCGGCLTRRHRETSYYNLASAHNSVECHFFGKALPANVEHWNFTIPNSLVETMLPAPA
jgi:hypothetical protein